jgi:hypothetical protein
MIATTIPLDAYVWTGGAVFLSIPALFASHHYRKTRVGLYRIMSVLLGGLGASLFLYGLPLFFTHDMRVIVYDYAVADLIFYSSLAGHACLAWYLLHGSSIKKGLFIALPFFIIAVFNTGILLHANREAIDEGYKLVDSTLQLPTPIISKYLEIVLTIPMFIVGMKLLSMMPGATRRAKFGYLSYGLLYALGSVIVIVNAVVLGNLGQGAVGLGLLAAYFVLFLITNIIHHQVR